MRIDDALRWQRLWWLLSLNFVQTFSEDLWLHPTLNALQPQLQDKINIEEDLPTFGSDPRSKTYRMLTWVRGSFGEEVLDHLCTWQRFIFAQGGDDRVDEHVWDMLAYELAHRSAELKLREELDYALQHFHELREKRLADLKKRLFKVAGFNQSQWDQRAVAAEGVTMDTVRELVANISSSNIFALTWYETCTSRGVPFLEEMFDIAVKVALEQTSGRLLFSSDALPFPSSWEFDVGSFLRGGAIRPR